MFVLQYQGLHDLLACAGAALRGANADPPPRRRRREGRLHANETTVKL